MALLEVRNLTKEFRRGSLFRREPPLRALDDVSFSIDGGEIFGLVGESGSGKTTAARCILRLIEPTSGEVRFDGENVLAAGRAEMRALRRRMQIVFQDPWSSLNPRMRIGEIVEEPLSIHGIGTRAARRERVDELLALVGLDPGWRHRYPDELSGGQRQRVGIARAIALGPSFLIADEPVSALDLSVQAQVLNLLLDLRERLGLTCLFIAHDLRLVRQVCNRVAVLYRGRLVELARTDDLFTASRHPYTQALIGAMPSTDPDVRAVRAVFNPEEMNPGATLVEVAPGHWAAT